MTQRTVFAVRHAMLRTGLWKATAVVRSPGRHTSERHNATSEPACGYEMKAAIAFPIVWAAVVMIYTRVFEPSLSAAFFIGMFTGGCAIGFIQAVRSVRTGTAHE